MAHIAVIQAISPSALYFPSDSFSSSTDSSGSICDVCDGDDDVGGDCGGCAGFSPSTS